MKKPSTAPFAKSTIPTLAEIRTAIEAFDRGDSNAFDALDSIIAAVEAHQAATQTDRKAA